MNEQLRKRLKGMSIQPYQFQIILNEDINQSIYDEFDIEDPVRTLGKFNHQLATIITVKQLNGIFYGLFKHGGEIIGWTSLSESYPVFPKILEPVKINMDSFHTHPFNREVGIDKDLVLALKDRLLSSKSYIEVNGEILEMVFLKGRLQGYVLTEDLHKGKVLEEEVTISADSDRFRDSNFDVKLPEKEEEFEAVVKLYFKGRNLVKLESKGWNFWMRASDIDYDFTINEVETDTVEEDVHYYYHEERQKSRSIIRGLVNRQIHLERDLDRTKDRLHRVETLYKNLRESKLGKMQVKIWKRKKRSAKR